MTSNPVEDDLWAQFHRTVNMSAAELEAWHRARSAGDASDPTGRRVLAVLRKRRVELTAEDVETMRAVVTVVRRSTGDREQDVADDPLGPPEWRERLCALGHDPLLPDPG
jgi:hypothetical protein